MNSEPLPSLEQRVRSLLIAEWARVHTEAVDTSAVPDAIQTAIIASVNSSTKTYRYVLLSQLLPKLVDPSLDCRSVQAGADLAGSFDARSICQHVIVPFDRENNDVLGGSTEPYANNPLRIPAIVAAARTAQKNKLGFDQLVEVLAYAQDHQEHVEAIVRLTLSAIRRRLESVTVVYPVPNRVSIAQTTQLLESYLSERTGGLRMQAVAVALFRAIADQFKLFDMVASNHINAADASTGSTADLECMNADGSIVMAVEVKDRQLELRQVQDKLPAVRENGVRELLFLTQGGVVAADATEVDSTAAREFVTGQNIYAVEWSHFLSSCLVLFGEDGRREFLQHVGKQLDQQRADLAHRQRWAELLRSI